jgi:hypothetical protein
MSELRELTYDEFDRLRQQQFDADGLLETISIPEITVTKEQLIEVANNFENIVNSE